MKYHSPTKHLFAIEIEAVLFPFHDELLQFFIPRMYYNYRIENRANEEPAAILFTSATRKDGIPPPPVRLSWDSRHPPPESVWTDGRMETELNNDERSAVRNAGDRARTLSKPGGLFKMAGICGIFPYGKQTRWLSTVLHG